MTALFNFFLFPITIILRLANVKFFYLTNPQAIGHLVIEPEFYVKEYKVGLSKKYNMFFVWPPKKLRHFPHEVCNKSLLNYWKKYLIVISSPFLCFFLWPLRYNKKLQFHPSKYLAIHSHNIYKISKLYDHSYKNPIINITQEHIQKGRKVLSKLNLPKNAWYVCFHARTHHFYSDSDCYSFRSSNIDKLFLALKEIEKRGGWCIRMGSNKAPPLPERFKKINNLIDYTKTPYLSDWMDIFLSATCHFFLASSVSGINNLASLFNKPVATANVAPIGAIPHKGSGLSIFKKYYSRNKKRFLTISEILKEPIATCYLDKDFNKYGIKLIDNSEEEIKDLVIEMFNKLEKNQVYSDTDIFLQNKFSSFFHKKIHCYNYQSKIGRKFLKKYKFLIH